MNPTDEWDWGYGPSFLPLFKGGNGGVDFLGLRQVNMDFMAECLPGVSNSTWHIRPFAVLSWVYWRFHAEAARHSGRKVSLAQQHAFRQKAEVLFTWGHQLAELSVPGTNSKCPSPHGRVDLNFQAWKRTEQTSLGAAVQYGPAAKVNYGFGFIESAGRGFYHATTLGSDMAEIMDARLARSDAGELVRTLAPERARAQDAEALMRAWRVDEPSAKERHLFRSVFFVPEQADELTSTGIRTRMIQLILAHLRSAPSGLGEAEIRHGLARGRSRLRHVRVPPPLEEMRRRWLLLQVRQAHRAALEGLLVWFEVMITSGIRNIGDVRKALSVAMEEHQLSGCGRNSCEKTLAAFLRGIDDEHSYHELCASSDERCFFALTERILEIADDDPRALPAHVTTALVSCVALTRWMQMDDRLRTRTDHGQSDRASLAHQAAHFEEFRERRVCDWISDVLERYVISQHLRVATRRFTGGTRRLRFAIEDDGFEFYADRLSQPIVSMDHLAAALSLMTECEIVQRDPSSHVFRLQ